MPKQLPTAIDLFNTFRPKFEQVELIPLNLVHSHWMSAPKEMNYLYLQLGRDGNPFSLNLWPTLNLIAAGVKFEFSFDGTKEPNSLWTDLNKCVIEAVKEQVLKGRVITMRPGVPENIFDTTKSVPVNVSVEGDQIPGLDLSVKSVCGHWEIFVPRQSPEGQAIEARRTLDFQTRRAQDVPKDAGAQVGMATRAFEMALQSVM